MYFKASINAHFSYELQSEKFDKYECETYHPECFFEIFQPESEFAIDGFARLRNEDKAKMRDHIGNIIFYSQFHSDVICEVCKVSYVQMLPMPKKKDL